MSKKKEELEKEEILTTLKPEEQLESSTLILTPTIVIKKFNVTLYYNYAQAIHYGGNEAIAELVNPDKGILKISDALLPLPPTSVFADITPFSVGSFDLRFSPKFTKNIQKELQSIFSIKIDMYNGIAAIDLSDRGFVYYSEKGYYANLHVIGHGFGKPAEEFGLILESPPRMVTLLMKGLVFVENLQQGFLKFRTSSFDKGYVAQLFPAAILEITQLADQVLLLEKTYPLKQVEDHKTKEHKIKEAYHESNHSEESVSTTTSSTLSLPPFPTFSNQQTLEMNSQEMSVNVIGQGGIFSDTAENTS